MTVASTTNRVAYTGTGAVSTYSYTFKIFANTDLVVTVVRTSTGAETTLTLTTDYTVTGVGEEAGGTIVLVDNDQAWLTGAFLATTYQLVIRRVRPVTQTTDIRNQGSFLPETHEDTFDHLVMLIQQLRELLNRVLLQGVLATSPLTLPSGAADKFLGWNAAGTAIVNKDGTPGTGHSSHTVADVSDLPQPAVAQALQLIRINSAGTAYEFKTLALLLDEILTTQGDVLIRGATTTIRLGTGTDGQVLTSGGAGANPAWESAAAGTDISARVYNSANISVADVTQQVLTFDTEAFDTDTIHSTSSNTGRLTATTAGKYLIIGQALFRNNATGERWLSLRVNGATFIARTTTNSNGAGIDEHLEVATYYNLSATDYVELLAYQDSGGALFVDVNTSSSPYFMMVKVP